MTKQVFEENLLLGRITILNFVSFITGLVGTVDWIARRIVGRIRRSADMSCKSNVGVTATIEHIGSFTVYGGRFDAL